MHFSPQWRLALMACQRQCLVWNCVCQTWAVLAAQQAVAQMVPEEQFQKALGKKKNQ